MHRGTFAFLQELAVEGETSVRVRGDCMNPQVVEGGKVQVRARRFYLPGDVLVFRTPAGDLAVHRVLGWRPDGLVTRGDRCSGHDATVTREAIVGAVRTRIPFRTRLRALASLLGIVVRRALR